MLGAYDQSGPQLSAHEIGERVGSSGVADHSAADAGAMRLQPYRDDSTQLSTLRTMRRTFEQWFPALFLRFLAHRLERVFPALARRLYVHRMRLRVRNGPEMLVRVCDLEGPMHVFGLSEYDFNVIDWNRVHTVIDAGAHVGSFSLWAGLRAHCQIYALEPNPEVFRMLVENLDRAGISPRVVVRSAALAGSSRVATLSSPTRASHGASIVSDKGGAEIAVQTMTLVEAIADAGYESVDFLKLDIEGAEYELFATASLSLLSQARLIVIECHPVEGATAQQLIDKLHMAGFAVASELTTSGLVLAWHEPRWSRDQEAEASPS